MEKRLTMQSFPPIEFAMFTELQSESTPVTSSIRTGRREKKKKDKNEQGSQLYMYDFTKPITHSPVPTANTLTALSVLCCRHMLSDRIESIHLSIQRYHFHFRVPQKPRTDHHPIPL
jgi:hypothetical protein